MTKTANPAAWPRALFAILLAATAAWTLNQVRAPSTRVDFRSLSDLLAPAAPAQTEESGPAAPPFYLHASSPAEWNRAVRCLTDAIYHEAGDEPVEGRRAVAQVVVNRVRDPNFPKSVCGVVYEGWRRRTGCQFSFVCDGSIRRRPAAPWLWDRTRPLAVQALSGYVTPEVGASTHYYADYVRPNWLSSVDAVTKVGRQIFCAWRGRAGAVSALTGQYAGGELHVSDAALDGDPPPMMRTVLRMRFGRRRSDRLRIAEGSSGSGRG